MGDVGDVKVTHKLDKFKEARENLFKAMQQGSETELNTPGTKAC